MIVINFGNLDRYSSATLITHSLSWVPILLVYLLWVCQQEYYHILNCFPHYPKNGLKKTTKYTQIWWNVGFSNIITAWVMPNSKKENIIMMGLYLRAPNRSARLVVIVYLSINPICSRVVSLPSRRENMAFWELCSYGCYEKTLR